LPLSLLKLIAETELNNWLLFFFIDQLFPVFLLLNQIHEILGEFIFQKVDKNCSHVFIVFAVLQNVDVFDHFLLVKIRVVFGGLQNFSKEVLQKRTSDFFADRFENNFVIGNFDVYIFHLFEFFLVMFESLLGLSFVLCFDVTLENRKSFEQIDKVSLFRYVFLVNLEDF
jgi:hypothetical protein